MDRNGFIQFLDSYNKGQVNGERAKEFLITYCIERGKKYNSDLENFAIIAIMRGNFHFFYAIQWYKIKYQIKELYKVLPNGGRHLILIY